MTINSKQKGKRGELELVNFLKKRGLKARRTEQYCGKTGDASDVLCKELKQFHIEVKRTEKFSLYKAYDQTQADKKSNKTGIIFHRSSRKPGVVVMDAEEFLDLIEERGVI